jgi:hypothetical protein
MRAAALLRRLAAPLFLLAAPLLAVAQDRPSEADLFGTPTPASTPTHSPTPTPASTDPRADDLLGADRQAPTGSISRELNDPLSVGGLLYLRSATGWTRGVPPSGWSLSTPALLDVYLDARPNDRVRGFALGRLTYSPTTPSVQLDLLGNPVGTSTTTAVLDQLWIGFDLWRTVFLTVGKQHVKWGTGRFWNPTDYLHPVRRDPLAQFDDRTGVTMVKAHLPWEARGWNLYGVAVLEDVAGAQPGLLQVAQQEPGTLGTLGHVGLGGRAEVVLGTAELGADAVAQRGHRPRFGLDASFALWDLDLHAELALRAGKDAPRWRYTGGDRFDVASYVRDDPTGITPALVVGGEWSWKYSDEDSLTVGLEYFYDEAGYDTPRIYPILIASPLLTGDARPAFTPFYLGRHYAGASLYLARPGSWNDTTLVLSAVANVSDGSFLVRLDHAVRVNTWLTLETFVAGHAGTEGGELRFGLDVPAIDLGGLGTTAPFEVPTPVLDLGVALRVTL